MNYPDLIFIPIDIAFFIKFEESDIQQRSNIVQATEAISRRICPTAENYFNYQLKAGIIDADLFGSFYYYYTLYDYFLELRQSAFKPELGLFAAPKLWHGAPIAALCRAFQIVANPLLKGIPHDIVKDLNILAQLYQQDVLAITPKTSRNSPADSIQNCNSGTVGEAKAAGHELDAITIRDIDMSSSTNIALDLVGSSTPYDTYDLPLAPSSPGSSLQRERHELHSDTV